MVKIKGMSVYKSSIICGIPTQTLRDRIKGKVDEDIEKSGPPPILSKEQESDLVDHILQMAEIGYGYTKQDMLKLACDSAVFLGLPITFSESWLYQGFLTRHPELKLITPRKLSINRARSCTKENIDLYFEKLKNIVEKYDLASKPHLIYNLDETFFDCEFDPCKVLARKGKTPQVITPPRGNIKMTCIGAGNALGQAVPPYLIPNLARITDDIKENITPGCGFHASKNGWSNSTIFQQYIKEHLIKFTPNRGPDDHLLLLYDGSTTHINVPLINWAKDQNVILFVLPPHTSHFLQPMDVGCFGPLKKSYGKHCQTWMRSNPGMVINKYCICQLVCKAYQDSMTPRNITNAFKKCGIFPLNPAAVDEDWFKPSISFGTIEKDQELKEMLSQKIPFQDSSQVKVNSNKRKKIGGNAITEGEIHDYLIEKEDERLNKIEEKRKKNEESASVTIEHNGLSIVIVEDKQEEQHSAVNTETHLNNKENETENKKSQKKAHSKKQKKSLGTQNFRKSKSTFGRKIKPLMPWSPTAPGPSRILIDDDENSQKSLEDEDDAQPCCICKKHYPPGLRNMVNLTIVKWAACSLCKHWVHLRFCTNKENVSKNETFLCPCCTEA